jgi:hypothetical protein
MNTWREFLRLDSRSASSGDGQRSNRSKVRSRTRSSLRPRALRRVRKLVCENLEDRRLLAAALLDVGQHVLLPNTPNQWIDIEVTGTLAATGFNFRGQVGDGVKGPAITDFQFDDGIGGSAYLWEEQETVQNGSVPNSETPGVAQVGVVLAQSGVDVTANGLLVSIEIDTTGIDQGVFEFNLIDSLLGSPSQFIVDGGGTHDPEITNGSITVIPLFDSPASTDEDNDVTLVPNRIGAVITVDSIATTGLIEATVVDLENIHYDPSGQFESLALNQIASEFITVTATVDGKTINQVLELKIEGRNDAPVAADDESATAPGAAVPINVALNDQDVDEGGLLNLQSIRVESPPEHGQVEVFAAAGAAGVVFLYRPSSDFIGTDDFTYTIEDQQGARSLPASVAVVVAPGENQWQNPVNPFDVDGDGRLTSTDVIQLINRINSAGIGELPAPTGELGPPPFFDVNGDGQLSPIDVLQVINQVNSGIGQAEGEGITTPTTPPTTPPQVPVERTTNATQVGSKERREQAVATEAVDEILLAWTTVDDHDLRFDF